MVGVADEEGVPSERGDWDAGFGGGEEGGEDARSPGAGGKDETGTRNYSSMLVGRWWRIVGGNILSVSSPSLLIRTPLSWFSASLDTDIALAG